MIMMTERDKEEQAQSMRDGGKPAIVNSATLRCLLSLRNLLFSNGDIATTFTPDLRVVVQLQAPCPFIRAVTFIDPYRGYGCVYPQDLTVFLNTAMFRCAAEPGLSRVLLELMNFDRVAIRTRKAAQCFAGPDNEEGWMIGKTVRECLLGHCWRDGSVMLGVDDDVPGDYSNTAVAKKQEGRDNASGRRRGQGGEGGEQEGYSGGGAPGIMGDPARIVARDDHIIFLSRTSSPQADKGSALDLRDGGNFDAEVQRLLGDDAARSMRATPSSARNGDQQVRHILVCGWRPEWTADLGRFAKRVVDVARDLPMGSTLTCLNMWSDGSANLLQTLIHPQSIPNPSDNSTCVARPNRRVDGDDQRQRTGNRLRRRPPKGMERARSAPRKKSPAALPGRRVRLRRGEAALRRVDGRVHNGDLPRRRRGAGPAVAEPGCAHSVDAPAAARPNGGPNEADAHNCGEPGGPYVTFFKMCFSHFRRLVFVALKCG